MTEKVERREEDEEDEEDEEESQDERQDEGGGRGCFLKKSQGKNADSGGCGGDSWR